MNLVAEQGPGTPESGSEIRLDRWLDEAPRSWRAVLRVFVDVAQALGSAHAAGIVDEDIRIENIMVGPDGRGFCRDHGSADAARPWTGPAGLRTAALSLEQRLAVTDAMDVVTYLAPEQFRGGRADARCNQFSFCVALYRALYRQLPFDHEWATTQGEQYTRRRTPLGSLHFDLKVGSLDRTTLMNLAREVLCENVRPAPEGADVPVWLEQVIQRGLRADPDDRYASMDELVDDVVEQLGDASVTGRVVSPRHPLAKWAILGGCGLLLLLGILIKIALRAR